MARIYVAIFRERVMTDVYACDLDIMSCKFTLFFSIFYHCFNCPILVVD